MENEIKEILIQNIKVLEILLDTELEPSIVELVNKQIDLNDIAIELNGKNPKEEQIQECQHLMYLTEPSGVSECIHCGKKFEEIFIQPNK